MNGVMSWRNVDKSMTEFFTEFEELLTSLGLQAGDELLQCGDFKPPGQCGIVVDRRLSSLIDHMG